MYSLLGSAELGNFKVRPNSFSSKFLGDTVTVAPPSSTDTSRFSMSSWSCSVMPNSLLIASFIRTRRENDISSCCGTEEKTFCLPVACHRWCSPESWAPRRPSRRRTGTNTKDEPSWRVSFAVGVLVRVAVCDTMDCCGVFDAWSIASSGFIGAFRRTAVHRTGCLAWVGRRKSSFNHVSNSYWCATEY